MTWLKSTRPLLVLLYDKMIFDLRSQLKRMCKFLEASCDEALLDCIIAHRDGVEPRYRQKHDYSRLFTEEHHEMAEKYEQDIFSRLKELFPEMKLGTLVA